MSSAGQGSISFSQKQQQAGPPFNPASADNGLSVDAVTGRIVLGNDIGGVLATLLSDREIPLGVNDVIFSASAAFDSEFIIAPLQVSLNDITNGRGIVLDAAGNMTITADSNFPGPGSALTFADIAAFPLLQWQINNTNGDFNFLNTSNGSNFLTLSAVSMMYSIGDTGQTNNGTQLQLDDASETARIETVAELMLFLAPQTYSMGNVNDTLNGSKISIDDLNRSLVFSSLTDDRTMALEGILGTQRIGDIDAVTNGLVFTVDNGADNFVFENTANTAGILINGVAGFTGTVAPVNTITVNNGIVTNVA